MPDFSMQNNYESAFLDNKHVSITIQNLGDAKKKKKKKILPLESNQSKGLFLLS